MSTVLASFFLVSNFLHENSYPLGRPEALILWVLIELFFAFVRFLANKIKLPWLFSAFLIVVILDYILGAASFSPRLGWQLPLILSAIFFLTTCYLLRKNVEKFILIGISTALAAGLVSNALHPVELYHSRRSVAAAIDHSEKGNVYILILDEHIGLQGLAMASETGKSAAQRIADGYKKRGFEVYSNAFSNFYATLDSIPSLLNARVSPRSVFLRKKSLVTNRLLEKFHRDGFSAHIYQNTHLNYADPSFFTPESLFEYKENSVGYMAHLAVPLRKRVYVLLNNFIESGKSTVLKRVWRKSFVAPENAQSYMLAASATPRVFRAIEDDALGAKRDSIFLAHFLMPHSDYLYDANGKLNDVSDWEPCYGEAFSDGGQRLNTDKTRERKYGLYVGQIQYLHSLLESFFQFLDQNGLYDDATIIVLSDHGSRILRYPLDIRNKESIEEEDLYDGYNAFFAVKKPRATSGQIITAPFSLVELFSKEAGLTLEMDSMDKKDRLYMQSIENTDVKNYHVRPVMTSIDIQ